MLRAVLNAFLFCICLLGSAYPISLHAPLPGEVGHRFENFRRIKDSVNILFLGSSFTYRQIIPPIIDKALADEGFEEKTYCLGLRAAQNHEANAMLVKILKLKPENLRIIVMESRGWRTHYRRREMKAREFDWWHTPAETISIIRSTLLRSDDPATRRADIVAHIRSAFRQSFNLGRLTRSEEPMAYPYGVDGWISYESRHGSYLPRQEFLDGTSDFDLRMERYLARDPDSDQEPSYNSRALLRQIETIEANDLTFVYLYPPTLDLQTTPRALDNGGQIPHVIDMGDPLKYPQFFVPENRYDKNHLSTSGSELYSLEVGRELGKLLKKTDLKTDLDVPMDVPIKD